MDDVYRIIKTEASAEIKVKGSRFIGETCMVATVDDALFRLEAIRKREYSATHHCYAYLVGLFKDQLLKYSDDGEPNGTAGKPIYDVIEGSGASNLLCVVTRYFGGTKLGTGGLVRAYGEAARAAMDKSGIVEQFLTRRFRLVVEFSLYDQWQRLVHDIGAQVVSSDYADVVT
ncbi:hypothetical protein GF377_09240, partial [candidate division GN15 bacterium]|nr:hypothetical protein [candidate division GN15 bacterium]